MKTPTPTPPLPQRSSEIIYLGRLLLGALVIVALIKGIAQVLPVVPIQVGWVLLLLISPALAMLMWLDGQRCDDQG